MRQNEVPGDNGRILVVPNVKGLGRGTSVVDLKGLQLAPITTVLLFFVGYF